MSFGSHEMVVRISLEGDYDRPHVHQWLGDQSERLSVHGWSRERLANNQIEILFAGDVTAVMAMLQVFTDGLVPKGVETVRECVVRGDEPVWLGFHHLPAA
ncbi:MAG: hypothetical protein HQ504_09380 [Rhodospirillaceae bacterium]|nr:hypothetical protein [Rhodospirillaceae bacterium]